jgi:hypothetical protein
MARHGDWSDEIGNLRRALHAELKLPPWSPNVLRCDTDESDRKWPLGREDYRRVRALRLELEAGLRKRARAARKANGIPDRPTPAPG